MFSSRVMQNMLLGTVGLVLALAVLWAAVSGLRAGKSAVVLKNASAIVQGIGYFFSDQNRYPTALEFENRNLMLGYFNTFPPQPVPGGVCGQTYSYASASPKSFELDFCLPKAAGGHSAGWNKVAK